MMKEEISEFEKGRKYLANMMGLDPETITQEEIDVSSLLILYTMYIIVL